MHQLVDSLRRQGVEAWLWPLPECRDRDPIPDYERYDAPESTSMLDQPDTAVVFADAYWRLPRLWSRAQKCLWWLSIDNSPYFRQIRRVQIARADGEAFTLGMANTLARRSARLLLDSVELHRITHLTQSSYAHEYIRRMLLVRPTMLGDYIPDARTSEASRALPHVIAFNPAKGSALTDEIRPLVDRPVEWVPLLGMDRAGVRAELGRAAVYLETGHQPGKDRLPREAAIRGAVVLMLCRGAGANRNDTPLAPEYKIDPGPGAARRFADQLRTVLDDLDGHRRRQESYVQMITGDRAAFDRAVRGIFVEGRRGVGNWYS